MIDPARSAAAPGRLLIVNADDFGMTPGICEAVLRSAETGIVTSTSALVVAPAFSRFRESLRSVGIGVGAHLAAVGEDPPLLSAREVPTLVDAQGHFPLTWRHFLRRAMAGRIDIDDLRREFAAQMDGLGLPATHLDTHQNLHLWPPVATLLLELAAERGIGAIRIPRTRRWAAVPCGVRVLSTRLRQRAARHDIAFPAASYGLDEAGDLGLERLVATVGRVVSSRAASAEIVTHIGLADDPDRSRYASSYRWADEFSAVCDPMTRRVVESAGIRLGSFADLSHSVAAADYTAPGTLGTRPNAAAVSRSSIGSTDRIEITRPSGRRANGS